MTEKFATIDTRHASYEEKYEMEYKLLSSLDAYDTREYSIEATLRSLDCGTTERLLVRDVTHLRDEADRVFRLISDGLVTPMTLLDVLYDLIA